VKRGVKRDWQTAAVPLLAAIMVPVKMLYVEGVVGDDMTVLPDEEEPATEAPAGAA